MGSLSFWASPVLWFSLVCAAGCATGTTVGKRGGTEVEDAGPDASRSSDAASPGHEGGGAAGAGGSPDAGAFASAPDADAGRACFEAKRLWFEDFEQPGYERWSSKTYNDDWGNACQSTARSQLQARSGQWSQRSEVVCTYAAQGNVHRGYGGLQFAGDELVPYYTNTGEGLDAPFGVVNTFWIRLETDTVFENGKWLGIWTAQAACDWSDPVLTLGIEDGSGRLASAHYWANGGGERHFTAQSTAVPRFAWTRITVYVSYYDDEMYVWQDGVLQSHTTFDRATTKICHFHWGLYASGDNDDIVLYEDDNSLWKLGERWSDFSREPYFEASVTVCPE